MINSDSVDIESENQDNYDDLVGTIEASQGILALLIAVCDNGDFRDEIIARYEAELQPEIRPYRLKLARGEPSLKAAIAELVEKDEYLQHGGKAVLTVTGAEQLYSLKLGKEQSEQEIFFGYLQWTREGLREFPYPIVLWVTQQMLVNLSKKAPDFWSWRKGVFRFQSRKVGVVASREIEDFRPFLKEDLPVEDESYFLPLEDLQQLIQQIERERGAKDPILVTLYASMGKIYYNRLQEGKDLDYQREQALAIEYFRKAIELQKELGLEADLATNLSYLAGLYDSQGRYSEAEPLYLQALELRKRLLGEDHPAVASSLNNLAGLYDSQGRYSEAEPLYLQALELAERVLGVNHPSTVTIRENLAILQAEMEEA
jgi:tetratricopeptide (TPR) repeat protein